MNLLIDNYDSFAYNLYQYLGEIDPVIRVVRNDEVDAAAVRAMGVERIVISPGPGYPADAGNCIEIIRALSGAVPILGVCLGHQAICEAFGDFYGDNFYPSDRFPLKAVVERPGATAACSDDAQGDRQ